MSPSGFDLSLHTNSTMAVICELGLDDVLAQLKPIAFAAEREALVSDQLDMTIGHWTKVWTFLASYSNFRLTSKPGRLPIGIWNYLRTY